MTKLSPGDLNGRSATLRQARAALRWAVRAAPTPEASRHAAAAIIERPTADAEHMWVGDVLHACRQFPGGVGQRIRAQQLLAQSGIWFESRELGELTDRQRTALVGLLRGEGQ